MTRNLHRGLLILFLLCLMLILYLSVQGLPPPVTRYLIARLEQAYSDRMNGVVLSVKTVKIGVFEGAIFTSIRCHQKGQVGDPILEADRMILKPSLTSWWREGRLLGAVIIRNGNLRLSVLPDIGSGDSLGQLAISNISARINLNAWPTVTVSELTSHMPGVLMRGQGSLVLAGPTEPTPTPSRTGFTVPGPTALRRALNQLQLSNAVNAQITFDLPGTDWTQGAIQVQLDSKNTRWYQSSVDTWHADLTIKGPSVQGSLELKNARVEHTFLEQVQGQFTADAQSLRLNKVEVIIGKGADRGFILGSLDYQWDDGTFDARLKTAFNPRVFRGLMNARLGYDFNVVDFPQSAPLSDLALKGRWRPEPDMTVSGKIQADTFVLLGITNPLVRATSHLVWTPSNQWLRLEPFLLVRDEGMLQGGITLDIPPMVLIFDAVSTVDPKPLGRMIHPLVDQVVGYFRTEGPVTAAGWGQASLTHLKGLDMHIFVDSRKLGWEMFLSDACSFNVRVLEESVEITDIEAALYRGKAVGDVGIYPPAVDTNDMRFYVQSQVHGIDFDRLMAAVTGSKPGTYEGSLEGALRLDGFIATNRWSEAVGEGWMTVKNGRVFQVPLFGGLTDFLTKVIPGMKSLLRQTDVKATFTIRDNKIHADEILIEGDVLSLNARGDCSLDGIMDFKVQVKLLRKHTLAADVVRLITFPVSKMLEFHLGGTIKEPVWRAVYFPRELFGLGD